MLLSRRQRQTPKTFISIENASKQTTAISSAAKQNDRLHELYLAQGMAKNLLFNFILLPNF